ncbi:MAG: ATP-binding cassette domain-containing protein, partial [Eubacteriaceae bacterium]|nr:ATP-binding cassette domain-containing protein [Eubacteriaceae bacterium]
MNEILIIESLNKTYEQRKVVDNVDLKIKKGEFICIIGASGCGKTTLLNLIGGFIPKDSGRIILNDREVVKPLKECVMVFQEFDQLFPWKTLKKNVEFPLESQKPKISTSERSRIALKYIQMMKLQGFENYYPLQLSGGMKQRTAIARALVTVPEIL